MMTSLKNHIALVTGAASGIGRAIGAALADAGAAVARVDIDSKKLGAGGYRCDLTSEKEIEKLAAAIRKDFGRLDVLVHSAGLFRTGRLEQTALEDLDSQFDVNVFGPYLLTQKLLPLLKKSKGQVVFINSSAIFSPGANWGAYSASKAALKGLADSLRQEVNADGIRVLSVYPGRTASPMQAAIHAKEGKTYQPERLLQPDDVAAMVLSTLTLPRTAEVTDLSIRPMMKG